MKRKFLFIVIILITNFCFAETNTFLAEYFDNADFSTKKYNLDFSEIFYSYQTVDNSNKFIKKSIFYIYDNNEILPLLKFDENTIFNSSEKMIDCVISGHEFYGWVIRFNSNNGFISADFYTNNGKNVADTLSFKLNKKTMMYDWSKIDPSEY